MAKFVENNRKESIDTNYGTTLIEYLKKNYINFHYRNSKRKVYKWVVRSTKHYLHSKQLYEQANKLDRTVFYTYVLRYRQYPEYVKIGFTSSMEDRLSNYRTHFPLPEDIEYSYRPTLLGKEIETTLLNKYSEYIVNGEWVKVNFEVLAKEIDSLFISEFKPVDLIKTLQ